jgi:hypothetical protein
MFICNAQDNALNKTASMSGSFYCPIRKISVERQGTRVKRFFVSEDISSELKNLTEYRKSGTPGDFPGAVFLVLFCAKKVRRD